MRCRGGMVRLLLALTLLFSASCAREKIVVFDTDEVHFLKPGETFVNHTGRELVIVDKGSYLLLVETALDIVEEEGEK